MDVSVTISPVKDGEGRIIGASKVARDITEHRRMECILREAQLSSRLLQLQGEERRRIARELRDGTGQLLAALSMNTHVIASEKMALSPRALRCIEENLDLVDQAISEIRTISHLLRPCSAM